ncbi:hypothetical protein NQ031_10315 [Staphylococcus borealis]|nr:hypothetical protein [Staphylococcus borealis]
MVRKCSDFIKSHIGSIVLIIMVLLFCLGIWVLHTNFIFTKESKINQITIYISYSGIFATFGGAYLGAKISGQYTMKALNISENNKKYVNKKRAIGLKKELINVTKTALDNARPQDGSGMFTFEENHYIRIRDNYIESINKSLNNISDFKMSENYYYLDNEDINELDNIYTLLSKLVASIEDLNSRKDEGQNENNIEFRVIKNQFFNYLDELYKTYY